MNRAVRGGDPLAGMYFIAALVMGVGSIVVIVLMFLPSDFLTRPAAEEVWTPGSAPQYERPISPDAEPKSAEQLQAEAELHLH